MRLAGRLLQASAMALLLVGLLLGLRGGPHALAWEFGLLGVGAAMFLVGLRLERR